MASHRRRNKPTPAPAQQQLPAAVPTQVRHIDSQWWNAHEDDDPGAAGRQLVGLINDISTNSSTLRDNTRRLISIFEYGSRATTLAGASPTRDVVLDESEMTFNIARNFIETLQAKLCKSRTQPMAMTEGATYSARRRGRQVDRAIEGEFQRNKVSKIKKKVIADALITDHGAGAAKVYTNDGQVCIEHVPIDDLRVDAREARNGNPRSIYQIHTMDKWQAVHLYPEFQDEILGAAGKGSDQDTRQPIGPDQVQLYEAWHLRSGKNACDGRHVIACVGATLQNEEYKRQRFPFALLIPRPRLRAFWGLSTMRDLAGAQYEHEKLTSKFQEAHEVMGMAGFMVPLSANVNPKEFQNCPGVFIEYSGPQPPVPFTPQPIHPDQYGYRESIGRDMSQVTGVSQLSASSQLPAGLQQASGKALQVYEDFESERLAPIHQALDEWTVDLAWLVVDEALAISEIDPDYSVRHVAKSCYEKICWKDVIEDKEAFELKVFAISALPSSPAGKFAELQELLEAGAINIEQFRRLYDMPDLESEMMLDTADTDIIDQSLDQIVIEGREDITPEPFDNLQFLISRSRKFYQLCRLQKVPEDALQRLRDFMQAAESLLSAEAEKARAAEEAQAQMAVAPGTPLQVPNVGPSVEEMAMSSMMGGQAGPPAPLE